MEIGRELYGQAIDGVYRGCCSAEENTALGASGDVKTICAPDGVNRVAAETCRIAVNRQDDACRVDGDQPSGNRSTPYIGEFDAKLIVDE